MRLGHLFYSIYDRNLNWGLGNQAMPGVQYTHCAYCKHDTVPHHSVLRVITQFSVLSSHHTPTHVLSSPLHARTSSMGIRTFLSNHQRINPRFQIVPHQTNKNPITQIKNSYMQKASLLNCAVTKTRIKVPVRHRT